MEDARSLFGYSADGFGKRISSNAKERKHPTPHLLIFKFDFSFSVCHFPIQAALFLPKRGRHSIPSFERNVSAIYNHFAGFIPLDLMIASSEHGIGSRPPFQNNAVPFGGNCRSHTLWLGVCLSTSWVPIPSNSAANSCDPVPSSSVSAHADG